MVLDNITCVHTGVDVTSDFTELAATTTIVSLIDRNPELINLVALPRVAKLEVDAVEIVDKLVFEFKISHGAIFTP